MPDDFEFSRQAVIHLMYFSFLEGRAMGYGGARRNGISPEESERLAELMDIVHNLPHLLLRWEHFKEDRLVDALRSYDEKWNRQLLKEYMSKRSGNTG
jgi:hypothetical protein